MKNVKVLLTGKIRIFELCPACWEKYVSYDWPNEIGPEKQDAYLETHKKITESNKTTFTCEHWIPKPAKTVRIPRFLTLVPALEN